MALKTDVKDRVPLYPGRVTMTPVPGQANTYDMERADSPTQEGTPINKALFDKKADALTENVTVYVSKSGNNTTGDGSSSKPYLTIQAALNSIPKNLDGHIASINISAGTYAEAVDIDFFADGRIILTGATGGAVTIQGLLTIRRSTVTVEKLSLSIQNAYLYVTEGGLFNLDSAAKLTCSGAAHGIYARFGSNAYVGGVFTVNNTTSSAVRAGENSTVYLYEPTGAGNTLAMAAQGGLIWYRVNNIAATAEFSTVHGGRIYTGAQTLMAKY